MNSLENFLHSHTAGSILDIACGGGTFTKRLVENLQSYDSVLGLDIKDSARDDFLKKIQGNNIEFHSSSVHAYLDSSPIYDTISISNALHHLENVGDIVKRIKGILSSNGVFIVNEMHRDGLTPTQQTQYEQHRFLAEIQTLSGEYHHAAWSRDEILGFIDDAEFTIQHQWENDNRNADVSKEPTRHEKLATNAIDAAYASGAPEVLLAELERLKKRSAKIGSSPPPQLTLVCTPAYGGTV